MAESADVTVQQLFKKWRSGDAESGQSMAQRFSDWYYAIAAVNLGDRKGRQPLDRACQAFAQGIVNIQRPGDLVEWAYGLIQQEVATAGGRMSAGDAGNALTGNRPPSQLLHEARRGLDPDQVQLLHLVYSGSPDGAAIDRLAEGQGGMPVAVLRARYTLKRLLRTNANVGFQETPLELNLDRCPLPLYEAGLLANAEEVDTFEKWMLGEATVCRDVAEFAAFTHALRAGMLVAEEQDVVPEAASAGPSTHQPPTPQPRPSPVVVRGGPDSTPSPAAKPSGGMNPMIIGGVVVGLIILVVAILLLKG